MAQNRSTITSQIASSTVNAIVIGNANSSKTTLALELASKAEKNIRVNVLCASRTLATYTRNRYIEHHFTSDCSGEHDNSNAKNAQSAVNNVRFMSVAAYAYSIIGEIKDGDSEPVKLLTASEQLNLLQESINEFLDENIDNPLLLETTHKILTTEQFSTELRTIIDLLDRVDSYTQYITKYSEKFPFWRICEQIHEKYVEKRTKTGKYDYNSVVKKAIECLQTSDKTGFQHPQQLIVDDAQELNPLQLKLIEQIAANGVKTVVIGSPQQTMQTYRGSIAHFERHLNLANASEYRLEQLEASENNNQEIEPQYHQMPDFTNQINYIISDIRQKHLKSGYNYSDFAIIARSDVKLKDAVPILSKHDIPINYNSSQTPLKTEKVWQDICEKIENDEKLQSALPTQAIWQAWEQIKPDDGVIDAAIVQGVNYINHLLDTVIFIINQAASYEKDAFNRHELPTASDFIAHILSQDLGVDVLLPKTIADSVSLLTPMSAEGLHFKTVYIIELQDEVWPNLKSRSPLLKAHILQDLLYGELANANEFDEAQHFKEIRNSEQAFLLNSIARASESVHIFAQLNEMTFPSEFFRSDDDDVEVALPILTLDEQIIMKRTQLIKSHILNNLEVEVRGITNALGSDLTGGENSEASDSGKNSKDIKTSKARELPAEMIYSELNFLQSVKNARLNTAAWYYNAANLATSSNNAKDALVSGGANLNVRISPSNVEKLYNCPLKWFYELHGATTASNFAANLGTIIHRLAELVPELVDAGLDTLHLAVKKRDESAIMAWCTAHNNRKPDDIFSVNTDINSEHCDPTYRELYQQYNILISKNGEFAEFSTELENMTPLEREQTKVKVKQLLANIVIYYRWITFGENGQIRIVALSVDGKPLNEQSYSVRLSDAASAIEVSMGGRIDRLETIVANFDDENGCWKIAEGLCAAGGSKSQENQQNYYIVDWKSGKYPKGKSKGCSLVLDELNLQILSYQIMLNRSGGGEISDGGCLVYLGEKAGSINYIKSQSALSLLEEADQELIDYILETVTKDEYTAVAGNKECHYCALKSSCGVQEVGEKVGQEVGFNG